MTDLVVLMYWQAFSEALASFLGGLGGGGDDGDGDGGDPGNGGGAPTV